MLNFPNNGVGGRVVELMQTAQAGLVQILEEIDQDQQFNEHTWDRPGGGGGRSYLLENGSIFERAGVNVSVVHGGKAPPSLAKRHPIVSDLPFCATGLSVVIHPRNPFVPAFHANFRYFEVVHQLGDKPVAWWFGGGADLTPSYPFEEDVYYFHSKLFELCDRHQVADYAKFKTTCDAYFIIPHRNEMRGVGGIFYDTLSAPDEGNFEEEYAFTADGIETLYEAYLPLVEKHKKALYSEREREWQLYRRGRYAEFNLVYDRGTLFGLQTRGNIEAILMSMPPLAAWRFDLIPNPGSPEVETLRFFQPRDWISDTDANYRRDE